jgi:hypothetical protein
MALKFLAIGLILGLLLLAGCGEKKNETEATSKMEEKSEPVDSLVITLQGVNGESVYELTKKHHQVESVESAVGRFVHTIDSVSINSNYGWMYSVNDTMGQVASDKYITHDSDVVQWHYRKF